MQLNPETVVTVALAFSLALGAVGTFVELVGKAIGNKKLEAIGDRIEAIGADLPKLFGRRKPPLALIPLMALALTQTACAGASGMPCNTAEEVAIDVRYLDAMRAAQCTGGNIDEPRCDEIRRRFRAERFAAMECVE